MRRTDIFTIQAMDCPTEEQIIRNRFKRVAEIDRMDFDLMNRRLTVEHCFTDDQPVIEILNGIGMRPNEALPKEPSEEIETGVRHSDQWRVGIALALALGSEVAAYALGDERSGFVIAMAGAAVLLGGLKALRKGLIALRTLTLNMNFLMTVATAGAMAIGEWPEAAVVIVLFEIAEMIEGYSLDRARNAIRGLMAMAPDKATVKDASGKWIETKAGDVAVDAVVRVRPGDRIPFDGEVIGGESTVDQAPITGESVPVEKRPGDKVFAGTINHEGVLEFRVTGNQGHTTLDRIIQTVQEAQAKRAPTQRFVDAFARVYTPSVVGLAALVVAAPPLLFAEPFTPWLYKALVLLVIACPCALVISTPVTVVSGLASAARRGILIKGGVHLENGRKLQVIALDKTGTLTEGKPRVTDFFVPDKIERERALQIAASIDALSQHPIAHAITDSWEGDRLPVDKFKALFGRGVTGGVEGKTYFVGNLKLMAEKDIRLDEVHEAISGIQDGGKTAVVLADEKGALAVFGVADTLRETSVEAIRDLHALGLETLMLTGDNERTAQKIAQEAGIDRVQAELSPEDKLKHIEELQRRQGHVGMVGDGVNDAPALAKAEIGFAMGAAGTDTALETADVALMQDDLRKVSEFICLSKRTSRVLTQNIAIALGVKFVFFGLALFGIATLWMAVFADMGASLIVVGNGLRLLRSL